ncbi:MAG: hypothetical protein ABI467_27075, partial [Kofleriaceae bacterium]
MRLVVTVVLVAGCGFKPTESQSTTRDAGFDAAPDTAMREDACSPFSTLFDTCTMASGGDDVMIAGTADYSTSNNTLVIGSATTHPRHVLVSTPEGMIDVLIANTFSVTGKLRVHGTNTFGIAAENGITL